MAMTAMVELPSDNMRCDDEEGIKPLNKHYDARIGCVLPFPCPKCYTKYIVQDAEYMHAVREIKISKSERGILNNLDRFVCLWCHHGFSSLQSLAADGSNAVAATVYRKVNQSTRYAVLKRQGWRCNSCAVKLKYSRNKDYTGEVAHIDHIFPYTLRHKYPTGPENINETENLQALCPECNLKKGARVEEGGKSD